MYSANGFCLSFYRHDLYLYIVKGYICMFECPCGWHKEYTHTNCYSQTCKLAGDQQNYSANLQPKQQFLSQDHIINQNYTRGKLRE